MIFGTEFGRTSFAQGAIKGNYGRDHHGGSFSVWMAGGGVKGGIAYGETDDFCYNIAKDPGPYPRFQCHHSPHARHRSHEGCTFRSQGR